MTGNTAYKMKELPFFQWFITPNSVWSKLKVSVQTFTLPLIYYFLYASHDFKCFLQVLASCLIHNTNFRKQTFVNDGRGINTNSAPRVWTYSEDLM